MSDTILIFQAAILNKYGTSVEGTGQLVLGVDLVHQSQAFFKKYGGNGENSDVFEKLSCSTLIKSVEQVLRAFKRAKKNMLEARDKVD